MLKTSLGMALVLGFGMCVAPLSTRAADPTTHTQELARTSGAGKGPLHSAKTRRLMRPSMRQAKDAPAAQPKTYPNLSIVNLEFVDPASCQAFQLAGTKLITSFQNFADIFVPVDANGNVDPTVQDGLNKLQIAGKLAWYEFSGDKLIPPFPRTVPVPQPSRALPDKIVRGGFNGSRGHGVIIAIVDSGIDFRHPDFVTYDAAGLPTSRVLYFWDTLSEAYANGVGTPAPISYPNGAPIGTVFSQADLTAELRGMRPRISEFDTMGHGTGCAGVAAGNGNASGGTFAGVAPEADIISVRVGGHAGSESMENASLIGAVCAWLDEKAGTRPLVVSCSYGGQYGGRDGYLLEERQISARFDAATPSRAICIAAGNEADEAIHAGLQIQGSDKPAVLTWSSRYDTSIELYLQTSDDSDIAVRTPPGETITVNKDFVHPLTHNVVVELGVKAGAGQLSIYSKGGHSFVGDAYIYGDDADFTGTCYSSDKLIGAPGAASQAITVGSYDFNNVFNTEGRDVTLLGVDDNPLTIGQLSFYSNHGPRRLGDGTAFQENLFKPDVVSPGEWHITTTPLNVVPTFMRDSTGYYQNFNGTSAATPYTAGVIALLFEKQPSLTAGEVKDLLHTCAQQDAFAQNLPGEDWGYGKLNYAAVQKLLATPAGK